MCGDVVAEYALCDHRPVLGPWKCESVLRDEECEGEEDHKESFDGRCDPCQAEFERQVELELERQRQEASASERQ